MTKTWEEVKKMGSSHYKTDGVEPIDLYRDAGILKEWALASIIKYAFRNTRPGRGFSLSDMDKIIHLAEMLKANYKGPVPDTKEALDKVRDMYGIQGHYQYDKPKKEK